MSSRAVTRPARLPAIRTLLAGGAALLVLAGGWPRADAEAQILPPIFGPPEPEEMFEEARWEPDPAGDRFTGPSLDLEGTFRYTPGGTRSITGIELRFDPQDAPSSDCEAVSVSESALEPEPDGTVTFSISSPPSLCNGVYQLTVTATAVDIDDPDDQGTTSALSADGVIVSLQPGPPTSVKATNGNARDVVLSWNEPSRAADFLGYRLQRSVNSGPFSRVGPDLVDDTGFDDTGVPEEATGVAYKVESVRSGATSGTTTTALSDAVAVSFTPAAPPPADTTTTVTPPDDQAGTGDPAAGGNRTGASRSTTPSTQFLPDVGTAEDDPLLDPEPGERDAVLPDDGFAGTVLQNFEDDGDERRALMVPLAIGMVLLVWAAHLRFLARQAS